MKLRYSLMLGALLILAGTSCEDKLDIPQKGVLDFSTYYKTDEQAQAAADALYIQLKGTYYNYTMMKNALSDDVWAGGGGRNDNAELEGCNEYSFGSDQSFIGGVWESYYQLIYKANVILGRVEPDTDLKKKACAEAKFFRAFAYFDLVSMWGDVPYIDHVVYNQTEMDKIVRTSIAKIKDYIIEDFNYAFEKLPVKSEQIGRASKPAALAFKGKLELYWACWNHFGWPELDTFTPSEEEARKAYKAAADDFHAVINDYGLNLFRNGEPGEWGELGDANVLPNYFYLFLPTTGNVNTDGEIIFAFTHGGPGTGQGESLMRDFAGRNIQNSQCWVTPTFRLADRYQSTVTGDFTDPLIPMNPNAPNARTTKNSAVNPESYLNRDYRMKASMLWDYEMIQGLASLKKTDWVPFIYKSWNAKVTIDGKQYTSYNTDGTNSGYVFRKFVRNYEGADRGEGDYNWPVVRLADVYLMYAEATNELYGPQQDAIALVNRIRHRGNLPPLASDKISDKKAFFDAIEQERIIELIAEGHRAFDLRRWRAIERVWGEPGSEEVWMGDTHSDKVYSWYKNLNERLYQQAYIFQIPPKERDRNPNLTQNPNW